MTREEARKAAEVMMAYADGKEIEFKAFKDKRWALFRHKKDRFLCFNFDKFDYRIKQEPTYRPFKDKEECWNEMQKHQPFGWVKTNGSFRNIIEIHNTRLLVGNNNYYTDFKNDTENYQFADGTPFGIKEE